MNNKDNSFVSGLALALALVFICLIVAGVNGSEGEKCIKEYCDREREEGEIYCYLHKPYKHNYSYDYDTTTSSSGNSSSSSSSSSSYKPSSSSAYDSHVSYDEGYEAVYEDDDYDWDRYYEDDDYAAGVDDAMDELEGDW